MNMDLIYAFSALAEHKSFTKAADILCISQSALSHRLNLLEEEIGEELIVRGRGKREFHLTPAGAEFVSIAARWIALEKDTNQFKRNRFISWITVSNVETLTTLFANFYIELTNDTSQPYTILLNTFTYPSMHILNEVEAHNIDIGFVVRTRISRNLKIEPIFRERLYLLGSLGSDKRVLDPRTLDPHKEIITDWYTEYRNWHDYYLGSEYHPLAVIDTATMAINFLKDGAWCIVPECSVEYLRTNCALRGIEVGVYEIPDPPPDRTCYKVTNRYPRGDQKEILQHVESKLTQYLKEQKLAL